MEERCDKLPPVTILIEWENALDVDASWTHRAVRALEAELERCRDRMSVPPRVMYLYDANRVVESDIRDTISEIAPDLPHLCRVELVPTPGLTYYKLKNHGVARTTTEFAIMLDSDAAPQPGWLPGILAPFEDPEIMAVGGFTVLGYNSLLSRVMALIWIFNLRSERESTRRPRRSTPTPARSGRLFSTPPLARPARLQEAMRLLAARHRTAGGPLGAHRGRNDRACAPSRHFLPDVARLDCRSRSRLPDHAWRQCHAPVETRLCGLVLVQEIPAIEPGNHHQRPRSAVSAEPRQTASAGQSAIR